MAQIILQNSKGYVDIFKKNTLSNIPKSIIMSNIPCIPTVYPLYTPYWPRVYTVYSPLIAHMYTRCILYYTLDLEALGGLADATSVAAGVNYP